MDRNENVLWVKIISFILIFIIFLTYVKKLPKRIQIVDDQANRYNSISNKEIDYELFKLDLIINSVGIIQ